MIAAKLRPKQLSLPATLKGKALGCRKAWLAWNTETTVDSDLLVRNPINSSTSVRRNVLLDPAYEALEKIGCRPWADRTVASEYAKRFGLTAEELSDIQEYTHDPGTTGPSLVSGLRKLPTQAGTSFRSTWLSNQTMRLLIIKPWLTVGDLTEGRNILASSLGDFAEGYRSRSGRLVIQADTDKDGGTWIAPLSSYGLQENESVFYGGTFHLQKIVSDSTSETTTIYLKHKAD